MMMIAATPLVVALAALLPAETYAFGAGQIPAYSRLHDNAYRHGDIDSVISQIPKTSAGTSSSGGSVFSLAQVLLNAERGGANFTEQDFKRVYFGNWLRDYSQALDIPGLSKVSADTIVSLVSVLGFVTFGSSTGEFEVTKERLGVYLPVEHVDNPRGYAKADGDARKYDPRLRPPVEPQEMDIDPLTGMKHYLATEGRGWDTSTAYLRRTLRSSIDFGRLSRGEEGADLWEAYRLLGAGLHTMEDLLAHSNWCELALRKMGHEQVFCYAGDNVLVDTPNGPAPPLITGTFGSADFLHSLKNEITDHVSQSIPADLSDRLKRALQNGTDSSILHSILRKLPVGWSPKLTQADEMQAKAKAYQFNPDDIMPPQAQQQIDQLLKWRDDMYRDTLTQARRVPVLDSLVKAFTDALDQFVFSVMAPYLSPALQCVNSLLTEAEAILEPTHSEQYVIFEDPDASDPSHSLLSKDHFPLILNQAAGRVATVVVRHVVNNMVNAWSDENLDPDAVIDQILEAFHHPYYATGRSHVQQDMSDELHLWFLSLGPEIGQRVLGALTKESVRAGRNKWQQVLQ